MSKRVTLEEDELKLIKNLLNVAMGQRDNVNRELGLVAQVTFDRLMAKIAPTNTTEDGK